jgi:hypothetical protein
MSLLFNVVYKHLFEYVKIYILLHYFIINLPINIYLNQHLQTSETLLNNPTFL